MTPFVYERAYKLSGISPDGGTAPIVVVGVRQVRTERNGVPDDALRYQVNHPVREEDLIFVSHLEPQRSGMVIVHDLVRPQMLWRFEPLTIELFDGMQESIVGYETLRSKLTSTDDVQDFYRGAYLDDVVPLDVSGLKREWIDEAAAYPIGTVRPRADGYDHQKMPNGEWVRIRQTYGRNVHVPEPSDEEDDQTPADAWESEQDIPAGGTWQDKATNLPESTAHMYEDDPLHPGEDFYKQPTPEREAVFNKIQKELYKRLFGRKRRVPDDRRPVAILTMGVPASGKSGAIANTVADKSNFVHIDPDKIKGLIPEFQEAKDQRARNAANIVHWESAWLAENAREEAIRQRMNFIFEGVGRDPEYYQEMIDTLKTNGYEVQIVMTHVEDGEEAVRRSTARGERTGRWVNENYIRSMVPVVPQSFAKLHQSVDSFAVFDTAEFPPKLAWASEHGNEVVIDHEIKDRILSSTRPKREEAVPTPHPAAVALETVIGDFVQAFKVDHAEMELAPRRFKRDQGIEMPTREITFSKRKLSAK